MKKFLIIGVIVLLVIAIILFIYSRKDNGMVLTNSKENADNVTQDVDVKRNGEIFRSHVVVEGDTLQSISEAYDISKESIVIVNDLDNEELTVGMKLEILPADGLLVVVKQGDTLDSIAQEHDVETNAIADYNWLDYPFELETGQELFIPKSF